MWSDLLICSNYLNCFNVVEIQFVLQFRVIMVNHQRVFRYFICGRTEGKVGVRLVGAGVALVGVGGVCLLRIMTQRKRRRYTGGLLSVSGRLLSVSRSEWG